MSYVTGSFNVRPLIEQAANSETVITHTDNSKEYVIIYFKHNISMADMEAIHGSHERSHTYTHVIDKTDITDVVSQQLTLTDY